MPGQLTGSPNGSIQLPAFLFASSFITLPPSSHLHLHLPILFVFKLFVEAHSTAVPLRPSKKLFARAHRLVYHRLSGTRESGELVDGGRQNEEHVRKGGMRRAAD